MLTYIIDLVLPHPCNRYAKWSDEALMHNSYAYDFGITSSPKRADVDGIVEALGA